MLVKQTDNRCRNSMPPRIAPVRQKTFAATCAYGAASCTIACRSCRLFESVSGMSKHRVAALAPVSGHLGADSGVIGGGTLRVLGV